MELKGGDRERFIAFICVAGMEREARECEQAWRDPRRRCRHEIEEGKGAREEGEGGLTGGASVSARQRKKEKEGGELGRCGRKGDGPTGRLG
jgi:hypothetical protein